MWKQLVFSIKTLNTIIFKEGYPYQYNRGLHHRMQTVVGTLLCWRIFDNLLYMDFPLYLQSRVSVLDYEHFDINILEY